MNGINIVGLSAILVICLMLYALAEEIHNRWVRQQWRKGKVRR